MHLQLLFNIQAAMRAICICILFNGLIGHGVKVSPHWIQEWDVLFHDGSYNHCFGLITGCFIRQIPFPARALFWRYRSQQALW